MCPLPSEGWCLAATLLAWGDASAWLVSDAHVLRSVECRHALLSLMYLHARVSPLHGRIATEALTTGSPWSSTSQLEHDPPSGLARDGDNGHPVSSPWSKLR